MESFISFSLELFLRIYDVQIEIYGKRTAVPVRSFHSVRRGREYIEQTVSKCIFDLFDFLGGI